MRGVASALPCMHALQAAHQPGAACHHLQKEGGEGAQCKRWEIEQQGSAAPISATWAVFRQRRRARQRQADKDKCQGGQNHS